MNATVAKAMALALVVGAVGLSVVPVATAGAGDCDEDFYITGTPATRPLAKSEVEIGQANVSQLQSEELTVNLTTADDELRIVNIFEVQGGSCDPSSNVSGCSFPLDLSTKNGESWDAVDCTLTASAIEDREFFVKMENLESSDGLEYDIHSD